jgi:hypothetical protein
MTYSTRRWTERENSTIFLNQKTTVLSAISYGAVGAGSRRRNPRSACAVKRSCGSQIFPKIHATAVGVVVIVNGLLNVTMISMIPFRKEFRLLGE